MKKYRSRLLETTVSANVEVTAGQTVYLAKNPASAKWPYGGDVKPVSEATTSVSVVALFDGETMMAWPDAKQGQYPYAATSTDLPQAPDYDMDEKQVSLEKEIISYQDKESNMSETTTSVSIATAPSGSITLKSLRKKKKKKKTVTLVVGGTRWM